MVTELRERTEAHVRTYFEKTRDSEISASLPQTATTVEQAIADFRKTQMPGATSYGKTIYADGIYIGDVWCYGINRVDVPNAMLSYCVFEKKLWGKGIATAAVGLFLGEITSKFQMTSIGAFTFYSNAASIRVLEKLGFAQIERFAEDDIESVYCQKDI